MNRSELIRAFRTRSGLSAAEADWFVRRFFEMVAEGMARDGRVILRRFGTFWVSDREQAGFRNPKNGLYYGSLRIKCAHFMATQDSD